VLDAAGRTEEAAAALERYERKQNLVHSRPGTPAARGPPRPRNLAALSQCPGRSQISECGFEAAERVLPRCSRTLAATFHGTLGHCGLLARQGVRRSLWSGPGRIRICDLGDCKSSTEQAATNCNEMKVAASRAVLGYRQLQPTRRARTLIRAPIRCSLRQRPLREHLPAPFRRAGVTAWLRVAWCPAPALDRQPEPG
jgi:hypothetical protein